MCGIFGFNELNKKDLESTFFKDLIHRGPDAQKISLVDNWTLGHLRLSIIDTSSAADQPFTKDGNSLIFNGEIYNYLELKKDYLANETMTTESDTEVLISLLNRYGINILNKLNGMFSFAWYDAKAKNLYLCRDRFGVKPLYYTTVAETFYFSSEIRPLANLKEEVYLDETILESFFSDTATDFDERSGIKDIFAVKKGHYLTIDSRGKFLSNEWYKNDDYIFDESIFSDKVTTTDAFEKLLTDAIAIRHRSDVPVCITLSGGLDSTTIYVLAKEHFKSTIKPFVFSHQNSATDESERAIELAKYYQDTPIIVKGNHNEGASTLKRALESLEYPIWNPSAVAYTEMYAAIKKSKYKVVIEGHGSDEQLGGYPYMVEAAWKQLFLTGHWKFSQVVYSAWKETQNPDLGPVHIKKDSKIFDYINIIKGVIRGIIKTIIWPKKAKYLNFDQLVRESFDYKILPIVLRTFDRLSMSQSLESRCPFMDYRVVEFLRKLPIKYKVNEIGSKAILRDILKKYGHKNIYEQRQKMGFATDLPIFFKQPEVRKLFIDAINSFNHPKYEEQKKIAKAVIQKVNIGWEDVDKVWKVTAIQLTEELYAKK